MPFLVARPVRRMKILTVVGARPQFIKAAALSRLIRNQAASIHEILVHTGQHYDRNMSELFFEELDIPAPAYHLGIGSTSHGAQTGRMLEKLEEVCLHERPDVVLVYGDTNSTLAGALAASKLHIPVAHVEAGLRSHNRLMPEEQNRVLTDHLAQYLFCPTDTAVANLDQEGLCDGKVLKTVTGSPLVVHKTGDIMLDAIRHAADKSVRESRVLDRLAIAPNAFVLATVHRAENTDDPDRLRGIFAGLGRLDREVIFALHPRTRKQMAAYGVDVSGSVRLIEPVGYLDMIQLEKSAAVVCTDSGGVQKEAYFLRTPCITLRDETEWVETVEDGWNHLCAPDADRIAHVYSEVMAVRWDERATRDHFGDGHAAERILNDLAPYTPVVGASCES
jgi:UDP-GlcNAc3NAcA epimerase